MSDDDVIGALRRLRSDDRWADRPFRTAARPATRTLPWRPALAFGLALAAVLGITVLIGQQRQHAAVAEAVPWAPLPATVGGQGVRPLDGGAAGDRTTPVLRGVTAEIGDVSRVVAGGSATYVVRLTNGTRAAVRLSPCPSYTETLTTADGAVVGSSRFRLNCAAAGSLGAGASRDFAMRVSVPSAGASRLTWRLDSGPAATKEIE